VVNVVLFKKYDVSKGCIHFWWLKICVPKHVTRFHNRSPNFIVKISFRTCFSVYFYKISRYTTVENCHRGVLFNWFHIDNIYVIIIIIYFFLHLTDNKMVSDLYCFALYCFRIRFHSKMFTYQRLINIVIL